MSRQIRGDKSKERDGRHKTGSKSDRHKSKHSQLSAPSAGSKTKQSSIHPIQTTLLPAQDAIYQQQQQKVTTAEPQQPPPSQQVSDDYKLLLSPMFAAMTKITDNLFLTGVGGMTRENFRKNHIDFVVNITTDAPFWENIDSMRIAIEDDSSTSILPYLDHAVDKIQEVIIKRNGHVLVHCVAGVSRSATIVLAYLMKHKKMDLKCAFNYCYRLRPIIRPNNGFMMQLISYEQQLFNRLSVKMIEADVDGTLINVPNFFVEEHPELVVLEVCRAREQLRQNNQEQIQTIVSSTDSTLQKDSTKSGSQTETQSIKTPHHKRRLSSTSSQLTSRHSSDMQRRTNDLQNSPNPPATPRSSGINIQNVAEATLELPIEVTYVDFMPNVNIVRHRTTNYNGPHLIIRRGELFDTKITFDREYDRLHDKVRLEFAFGPHPSLQDGSLVYVPIIGDKYHIDTHRSWDSRLLGQVGRKLEVQVSLPSNIPIGLWHLRISTKLNNSRTLQTFKIRDSIYILFNPWSPLDDVYLAGEDARQEYLNNEIGMIYVGSNTNPVARKWTYGQFDQSVLPVVIQLLDKSTLTASERSDVVKTSRVVSAIVNSHDDIGLLVGNWSGNYMDGLSPWQWTGSAAIFKKYVQNGYRPVKFGQCWVFGGVLTTALRAIGIPARTISNFVSAHDTDSSLTVDKFFSNGDEVSGVNADSIWNFHVWSDAWMARRDLPPGFGGWQAVDSTPQEQSGGRYQLGPASLEAVKQGKVTYAYDVGFVFSEVNADLVHWQLDGRSRLQWRKSRVQDGHVGRRILTKKIGSLEVENIVSQYKYKEGSPESRKAYAEATKSAGLQPLFDQQ